MELEEMQVVNSVSKSCVSCVFCNLSFLVCDFNKHVVSWGTCSHWVAAHRDDE
jgi:hypothetical protein